MDVSDSDLMARLAAGDDLALNVLMDRWSKSVASFLHKMTGNRATALDLAQETFVNLYNSRRRYRAGGNFSTYLFSIAANLARNHARWKSRHPTVSLDATPEYGVPALQKMVDAKRTPEETAQVAEKFRVVHEAFIRLPPDLREAMTLFVYEGMGYSEIAAVSKCSTKAVETRIYRARQILKEQLNELLA